MEGACTGLLETVPVRKPLSSGNNEILKHPKHCHLDNTIGTDPKSSEVKGSIFVDFDGHWHRSPLGGTWIGNYTSLSVWYVTVTQLKGVWCQGIMYILK